MLANLGEIFSVGWRRLFPMDFRVIKRYDEKEKILNFLSRNSSVEENENILLIHVEWHWFRGPTDICTSLQPIFYFLIYHFIYHLFSLSSVQFSSVRSLSHVGLFATPWIAAHQASLSITNSRNSLRLTSIESVMPSSHLILCCPLLLLPPIPPSIRVFSNESTLRMRWPKYWSFSFSIIPSKEHPGLISFRMDWLDLLAVNWV